MKTDQNSVVNVIYDGDCSFCIRSLRVVRFLDWRGKLRFFDAHHPQTLTLFPALGSADLDEAMYAVVAGETAYSGYFAFRRILWSNPSMWTLIPLFYFPLAGVFGPRVYAWVAGNRSKFGCVSDSCGLPPNGAGNKLTRQGPSL